MNDHGNGNQPGSDLSRAGHNAKERAFPNCRGQLMVGRVRRECVRIRQVYACFTGAMRAGPHKRPS